MVLGITEDFTSTVVLDKQLKSIPTSGLYLNSGVHPAINVKNLLYFLPIQDFTFAEYDDTKTYGVFLDSRNITDIVSVTDEETNVVTIYQSIKADNLDNLPSTSADYWLETNIESLRIKMFIEQVKDRVYRDLALTKRLVNNQYLYENGKTPKLLENDYAAWVLEPKGSDYVSFRINQISIQADGTTPIDVYILNQNTLLDTITITPNNGEISFVDTDIVLSGKGAFKIAIDSQDVYVGNAHIDPLKFDGFVAYTATGTGNAPETSTYTASTNGIGVGLNISAYMDGTKYINNNLDFIANFIRATFEVMVFETYLHNPNARSNRAQRILLDDQLLIAELKNADAETLIKKFHVERKRVVNAIQKTFDTQLNDNKDGLEVKISSI